MGSAQGRPTGSRFLPAEEHLEYCDRSHGAVPPKALGSIRGYAAFRSPHESIPAGVPAARLQIPFWCAAESGRLPGCRKDAGIRAARSLPPPPSWRDYDPKTRHPRSKQSDPDRDYPERLQGSAEFGTPRSTEEIRSEERRVGKECR